MGAEIHVRSAGNDALDALARARMGPRKDRKSGEGADLLLPQSEGRTRGRRKGRRDRPRIEKARVSRRHHQRPDRHDRDRRVARPRRHPRPVLHGTAEFGDDVKKAASRDLLPCACGSGRASRGKLLRRRQLKARHHRRKAVELCRHGRRGISRRAGIQAHRGEPSGLHHSSL